MSHEPETGVTPEAHSPVRIVRRFPAKPERVFDAWIVPDQMRRWMFVSSTNEIRKIESEPRVGGRFSILEQNGKEEIDHFGEYRAIDRPSRLVFTLTVPRHFEGTSEVTIEIQPDAAADGCVMTFGQTGVRKEITEGSWLDMFETLTAVLETSAELRGE